MHPNAQLVEKFYSCFQVRDADGMCACCHPDILFSDPVFGTLRGPQASAMWHMLCARADDLKITFDHVQATDTTASAHWEARYPFSRTGRQVHNVIEAAFVLREGQIVQHTDTFDFWRWAGMALGPVGRLLGWTPILRKRIRSDAARSLEKFISKQAAKSASSTAA